MKNGEIQDKYESFWKDIVENEDGTINKEQVMRELYDFSVLIWNVSKVYDHITDGKVSNPLTCPDIVIALSDDLANVNECSFF
ncbi:hypothetical protein [Sulfurovum sp.]|uniref:hypothetical protein n=1 Tax=Sulfurovum sp. TaxID=1969726 RepID=UPI0026242C6C|nr:hypothetical protein [Sulfurovum sp.]